MRVHLDRRAFQRRGRLAGLDLDVHKLAHHVGAQLGEKRFEQFERFLLVFVQWIALAVTAQADILAQVIQIDDVLAPIVVQRLQQDRFLDIAHDVEARIGGALRGAIVHGLLDAVGLHQEIHETFGVDLPIVDWTKEEGIADEEVRERILKAVDSRAAERAANTGPDVMRYVEKAILLQTLDQNWREHIINLDHLRQYVGLRGYGQRDPLNEYKQEAFELFEALLSKLRVDVVRQLMHIQIQTGEPPPPMERAPIQMQAHHYDPLTGEDELAPADSGGVQRPVRNYAGPVDPNDPNTWGRVQRNAPCPCGSGRKFKHCHGALV